MEDIHLESMEQTDRHPIVSFISALFWVVCEFSAAFYSAQYHQQNKQTVYLLSWVKALVGLVTISVPRLIYSLLSYSMTLTVRLIPTLWASTLAHIYRSSTFGRSPCYSVSVPSH
jgi:hypothetical protein